jgi:hypothetical protein
MSKSWHIRFLFALCLLLCGAVFGAQWEATGESGAFVIDTRDTIEARTVSGSQVTLSPLDDVSGVPTVDGVAISGWSASNPYWDTTTVSDGVHTLTYGSTSIRIIVFNNTDVPLNESNAICVETRGGFSGHVVRGSVRVAPLDGVSATPTLDGKALSGWSASAPNWDTTGVADGWHTLSLDSRNVSVMVLNSDDVEIHGGALSADETWSADKLHLVQHWVHGSEDAALTIANYATVKLCSDTGFLGDCSGNLAAVVEYSEDEVKLFKGDVEQSWEEVDGGKNYVAPGIGIYSLQVPMTPALQSVGSSTTSGLSGKTGVYYTLDGTEPTKSSAKLSPTEAGDAYEPIEVTLSASALSSEVRLAWLEEKSGSGNSLYEPNWGYLPEGKALRSVRYTLSYSAVTVPVTLNGVSAGAVCQGESASFTAAGEDDEVLWRTSDVGKALFAGWTQATFLTDGGLEHTLDGINDEALSNATLTFTAPMDAVSITLASATAAVPSLSSYLTLSGGTDYTLKTVDGEAVTMTAYSVSNAISREVVVKPVFSGDVSENLLKSCVVECALEADNSADSLSSFGCDEYSYEVLGNLSEVKASGAKVTVKCYVASNEDALRMNPRMILRIRDTFTGATFGYRIYAFVCPNYLLVNGTPVFAEAGKSVELSVADYLASGSTLTGWSGEGLSPIYNKETGKITVKLPASGQASLTLDSTSNVIQHQPMSVPVKLNGTQVATGTQGKSTSVTAPGVYSGENLWNATSSTKIFAGWTNAVYTTESGMEHTLDGLEDTNPLSVAIPSDAASVSLTSDSGALPTVSGYLPSGVSVSKSLKLKTINSKTVSLEVVLLTTAISAEVDLKPVVSGTIAECLKGVCDVEYCLTEGNDDDSSSDFGYDGYEFTSIGSVREVTADGCDSLVVDATVATDEASMKKAPRLVVRMRQRNTGVTFGYRIYAFVCPNYLLVNGTPVFAEAGKSVELTVADYLTAGDTFVGWSAASDLEVSYDKENGKISLVVPSSGLGTLKINGTATSVLVDEKPQDQVDWTVSLTKGWNLIATGLYTLDDDSAKRLSAFKPWIHKDGTYEPMDQFVPAHAYWVFSETDQTLKLSGHLQ